MKLKKRIAYKIFRGQSKAYLDQLKEQSWKNKIRIFSYNFKHNRSFSPYPLYAKIEINGSCNLDCVMCLRKSLANRNSLMSKKQFISILNNIPSLIQWSPHGYNEPLLHPLFFDFVKEANNRSITLYLVTNGTAFNKENVDKLIKLEPKDIRISIDAVGKTYEKIRRGSDFNQVCKNIKYLTENYDKTSLYATIWKDNLDQIPLLISLAKSFNIPISFSDITWKNEFGQSTEKNSIRENLEGQIINSLEEKHKNYYNKVSFGLGRPIIRKCTLPWSSIYVDVIGNCYPCTDTLNYLMGNIFENHIKDIYNNKTYSIFREDSLQGNNFECKNCASWCAEK